MYVYLFPFYLGILWETEIDQAIQAFNLESDIDFYPIFIFDVNDVGKNCWASTFSYSDNSIQTESLDGLINICF